MSKFSLFGKLIAKEGERDTLVDILLEAAASMENIIDCELYIVNVSDEDSNAVFVYEVWKNESAHQASLLLEVTQTLIQRAKPLLIGMERINTLVPRGGKGISTPL
ncbi:putative quinol monooxygenase [Metabacillus herbersteinensis]|uniref:Quinol monooxygenase n=1 Tax=Metabacillus herbersteinensis TaxID=283816 RepID=A0ABV6GIX3_9BACI